MESVGTRLKNKRLEKGLTLEEVQKKTKIHLNILRSIEDDSLVGVSPIYIKGFLKIYCKFLGVDPREYIPDYKEPQARSPFSAASEAKSESAPKVSFTKLISYLPRIRVKTILTIGLAVIGVLLLFQLGKFISKHKPIRTRTAKHTETVSPVKTEKKTQAQPEKNQKIPAASTIKVGVRAKENCYLTLKADGRLVFQGLFRKGSSETWSGKEKIEFSLNNAGVVELQINGKTIPGLGRKGQAVKGIVTKEEGLKILS
ncbi:MAG: DUF4115 domain-containing protein [Candidatus Omnitrophica bacterium]|nr:DUF4115 domain-containing protein [Candidatus Omnitrophota bacterium]